MFDALAIDRFVDSNSFQPKITFARHCPVQQLNYNGRKIKLGLTLVKILSGILAKLAECNIPIFLSVSNGFWNISVGQKRKLMSLSGL